MMSQADKDLLEHDRVTLMEGINLTETTLLAGLRKRKVITGQQEEVFRTEAGNTNQVGALLNALLKGDEDTLDNFIYALKDSGHAGHIALTRTTLRTPRIADKCATPVAVPRAEGGTIAKCGDQGEQVPGNEKDILRKHQLAISSQMTSLIVIVDGLHGEKVISDNDKEEIKAETTPYKKNSALVTSLMKKAQKGFPVFVRLLKETDQDELAALLTRG